jgi:hypothetical protein
VNTISYIPFKVCLYRNKPNQQQTQETLVTQDIPKQQTQETLVTQDIPKQQTQETLVTQDIPKSNEFMK